MANVYIVVRKAVVQGQEGPEFVAVYLDHAKARHWIDSQAGEYYSPTDYTLTSAPLIE